MRASFKNRVEIIKLIKAYESQISVLWLRVERLREINQKDYWTKSEVDFLNDLQIFLRARITQHKARQLKDPEEFR